MSLRGEWAALRQFWRAPRRMPPRRAAGSRWLARTLLFAVLILAINVLLSVVVLEPLADWAGVKETLPERMTLKLALLGILFAPIFEELLLRAGLRRADYALYVGPPLLVAALAPGSAALPLAGALALATAAAYLAQRWKNSRTPGARFASGRRYIAHFAWVYWGYATVFALAHAGNYQWRGAAGGVVVLAMVLPQFIFGVVAGYLRLRDGLRSSIVLHVINNAVAVALWDSL